MIQEVRRAGDGSFYLVSINEEGISKEVYIDGKLLKFEISEEAKDYIKDYNKSTRKRNRRY